MKSSIAILSLLALLMHSENVTAQVNWKSVRTSNYPPVHKTGLTDFKNQAMAFDSARNVIVLQGYSLNSAETWEYDGRDWSWVASPMRFPTSMDKVMVYDSTRNRCVLVSGSNPADTWELDGASRSWSRVTTTRAPGFSAWAVNKRFDMAFDSARSRVVLYGAGPGVGLFQLGDETWEYDGLDWTKVSTLTNPPPLADHAMAYDSLRKKVVMQWASTWEFDGHDWRKIHTKKVPFASSPEVLHMAFDSHRGVCVLVDSGASHGNTTWEYDGIEWFKRHTPRSTLSVPHFPDKNIPLAFDSKRNRIVEYRFMFTPAETQEYYASNYSAASLSFFGTGCNGARLEPDPSAPPTERLPWVGFTLSLRMHFNGLVGYASGIIGLSNSSLGNGAIALPWRVPGTGCDLLVSPVISTGGSKSGGYNSWSIPIPASPNLVGGTVYLQGMATPSSTWELSNGIELKIGSR